MAVNRYYSSTAQEATLTASLNGSATTASVSGTTGFPVQYPYTLILDRGTATEEVVEVSAAVGVNLTIMRGMDGTSAVAHSLGASVVHGVSARDLREPQEHIAAAAGVHGVTGNVVGTTDAQTLTNKTISGGTINNTTLGQPAIADFTSAQHDHGSAAKGGPIPQTSVTGLDTRITAIETKNTSQDSTLTNHDGRLTTNTNAITALTTRVSVLEGGLIAGSFQYTPFAPVRNVTSTTATELVIARQTFTWTNVTWPPHATTILVHAHFSQAGASDTRVGAQLNGTPFSYYGYRPIGTGSNFSATGEITMMVWDVPISQLANGTNTFSYWAWKDQTTDANWQISSMRTWMTII